MGRDDLEQLFVSKPNGSFMVEKTLNHPAPDFAMCLTPPCLPVCVWQNPNHPPLSPCVMYVLTRSRAWVVAATMRRPNH